MEKSGQHPSNIINRVSLDYPSLSDFQLIQRIRSGDQAALGALYDRHANLIFSIALNTLRDKSGAEEVTQDVFLRVWNKAESYDTARGQVNTWLCTIARYRAIDMLRGSRVRIDSHTVDTEELSEKFLRDPSNVETATDANLEQQRVRAAIAKLPQDQSEVLALAYFTGYTHQEIAKKLKIPLGTAKTRIRLALQKLRGLLAGD
jgi:RNA polymerase sigma-70 factor, ECF subfamily